jgi:ATP-dependent Clp protease ATP-binding subunit ClpA
MGARPMLRLVQNKIKKPLAEHILFGALIQGGDVHVTVENDDIKLDISAASRSGQVQDDENLNTEDLDA